MIGSAAIGIQGDVSNLDDLDRLYEEVKEKFGHIHILFANAGVVKVVPFDQVTPKHFDHEFNVNVRGLFFTVQKALPLLKDGASIILNSSISGSKGMEGFSVYSATKSAVRSFARTLANELKPRGIRVNAISPGPIETPIFDKVGLSASEQQGFKESIKIQVPLGRMGSPTEIANTVLFLACDDSSYITGVDLAIDGGMAQV